jgi:hypothetical protein
MLRGLRLASVDGQEGSDGLPQPDSTAAAISDLYRACHLCPPAVFVARDALHFARIVSRLVCSFEAFDLTGGFVLGMLLFTLPAMLTGDVSTAACGALAAVLMASWVLVPASAHRGMGAALSGMLLRVLFSLFLGATVAGLALLAGAGGQMALRVAGATTGATACAQLVLALLTPSFARWQTGRTERAGGEPLPWPVILWGAARVDAIMTARLASALQEVEQTRGGRGLVGHRGPEQWAMQSAIREEARRLGVWTSGAGLVLGKSIGYSTDPAAQVSALGSAGADPAGMSRILRAAIVLDHEAEAVAVFRGVAVVLPAGAPAAYTPAPAAPRAHRRSGQLPWLEALRWLGDAPVLSLAIDLAPSDKLADRLLALRLRRLPGAARRTPAIRALGAGRSVAALGQRPVQEDDCGQLYQIGRREDPSTFVAVRDRVLDADGTPLEHWIAVPPHIATAREAVAWSFGMNEAEYRPVREA